MLGPKDNSSASQGLAHTGYEVDISIKTLQGSVWWTNNDPSKMIRCYLTGQKETVQICYVDKLKLTR